MSNLGQMLASGTGAAQDEAGALRWFRQAAALGEPRAMYCLGALLVAGQGVAKDEAEAARWFHRAAQGDDPEARALARDQLRRLGQPVD